MAETSVASNGASSSWNANPQFDSVLSESTIEEVNQRIKNTTKTTTERIKIAEALLKTRPLGLKLRITPTFLNSVEMKLFPECNSTINNNNFAVAQVAQAPVQAQVDDFGSQPMSEKLKASNFSAFSIQIGEWVRYARYEGDVVAKCYFAKKKLVWEFLNTNLKSKIEIQWSDILAIRAVTEQDKPGILEIEVHQPPTFHEETDPKPRKHTIWRTGPDFTGGQASIYRRHKLVFPPGALDKHYEKLLQCDSRLLQLSQRPFPSLQSPYFVPLQPNPYPAIPTIPYDYHRLGLQFPHSSIPAPTSIPAQQAQVFPHSTNPAPSIPAHQPRGFPRSTVPAPSLPPQQVQAYQSLLGVKESASPISVMEFSPIEERMCNQVPEEQLAATWGQGSNMYADTLGRHQVQVSNAYVNTLGRHQVEGSNAYAHTIRRDQIPGSNVYGNTLARDQGSNIFPYTFGRDQVQGHGQGQVLGQGSNVYANTLGRDQVQRPVCIAPSTQEVNPAAPVSCLPTTYGQGAQMLHPDAQFLSSLHNQMSNDFQVGSGYDDNNSFGRVGSWNSLINLPIEENNTIIAGNGMENLNQVLYGQNFNLGFGDDDEFVLDVCDLPNGVGELLNPQPLSRLPTQFSNELPMMHNPGNNFPGNNIPGNNAPGNNGVLPYGLLGPKMERNGSVNSVMDGGSRKF